MQELSDFALIDLLKADDKKAFNELYHRYCDQLFAVGLHILNSPQDAEEAVHDVFLRIWQQRHSISIQQSVNHYLAAAVKFEMLGRLRKLYRREQLLEANPLPIPAARDTINEQLREKELMQELEQTVQQLPEKCRIVYQLSRQQGYSAKEIASALKISENTVQTHLSKALRLLRHQFSRLFFFLL
jgi:RNA polymerase sigma-70 factor (family 1)